MGTIKAMIIQNRLTDYELVKFRANAHEADVINALLDRDLAPLADYIAANGSISATVATFIRGMIGGDCDALRVRLTITKPASARRKMGLNEAFNHEFRRLEIAQYILDHGGNIKGGYEAGVTEAQDFFKLSRGQVTKLADGDIMRLVRGETKLLAKKQSE